MADSDRSRVFSDKVFSLFATSVITTGIGVIVGFILARALGPSGKGDFYLVTLLPVTIMVFIQFGLPQAFGFYAAQGRTKGLTGRTVVLAAVLAGPALLLAVVALPLLSDDLLHGIDPLLAILGLAVLPLALHATFTTAIVLGRQAVRWYAAASIGQSLCSIALFTVLVAVLGEGLVGAMVAFFILYVISALAFLAGSLRITLEPTERERVRSRDLFGYGLSFYPSSLTQFFNLRIDVYLLAFLLTDPSAPIGYYSMAVTMAQLVFFVPNAVSSLFFPHVAGSDRDEVASQVPIVTRVTLLVTSLAAIGIVPVSIVVIYLLLPGFEPSLAPLFVLLPGVVALSQSRVLTSYLAGLGITGRTSVVNVATLAVNVIANLLLIPRLGIVGAAAASLISYSFCAVAFSILASRHAGTRVSDLWLPRSSDVRFVGRMTGDIAMRLLRLDLRLR